MKMNKEDQLNYTNDMVVKEVKNNFITIVKYCALFFWWHFTLSFQDNFFYYLMNILIMFMLIFTCLCVVFCKEEEEVVLKRLKNHLFYYLTIVFVYDTTVLIAVQNSLVSTTVDTAMITAKNLLTYMSIMVKVGYPIAYIVWMLQKLATFKNGIKKLDQIKVLRNIKETKLPKNESRRDYNNRY